MRKLLFLAALSPAVRWALAALAGVMVVVAVLLIMERPPPAIASVKSALGLQRVAAPKGPVPTKPICSQVIVPAGDCIPQHLANLPPDPGPEGMKTIEGIDADKDGVRDDVQRYIADKWGHSERAVKALTLIAKEAQDRVRLGDSVSRDEAYAIAGKSGPSVDCYSRTVDPKIRQERALDFVTTEVTNTPARFERYQNFDRLLANRVFVLSDLNEPFVNICGYDPAALPN